MCLGYAPRLSLATVVPSGLGRAFVCVVDVQLTAVGGIPSWKGGAAGWAPAGNPGIRQVRRFLILGWRQPGLRQGLHGCG